MLDDYFAGRAAWDTSLGRATGEWLDALGALYGVMRDHDSFVRAWNRHAFPWLFPVRVGVVADLCEWMVMTGEQRLDWMARALRDRRAASSEPAPSRLPRTALPLLGWRASLSRVTPAGRGFTRWFLYAPPGATS